MSLTSIFPDCRAKPLVVALLVLFSASAAGAASPTLPSNDSQSAEQQAGGKTGTSDKTRMKTEFVLGISWHAAFCESGRKKAECDGLTADSSAAKQFTLQGLWKNRKNYCDVSDDLKAKDKKRSEWLNLPEVALDEKTKTDLAAAMPGVVSGLDRHEWVKHGTCSGLQPAEYYSRSLHMLAEINASPVEQLFSTNIGKSVTEAQIKSAFDAAFGAGAGGKVKMRCRKDGERSIITGLTLGLGTVDASATDVKTLMASAKDTKFGCAEGVVDAVGQQ